MKREYINQILVKEEKNFSIEVKNFWCKYLSKPSKVYFETEEEYFYIVLKYKKFAIYFNDIEEFFGICILDNNKCIKNAEFFDSLNPTIMKLFEIENNSFKNWFD